MGCAPGHKVATWSSKSTAEVPVGASRTATSPTDHRVKFLVGLRPHAKPAEGRLCIRPKFSVVPRLDADDQAGFIRGPRA